MSYTRDEIRNGVKQLLAELLGQAPDQISDDASFLENLGIDSLMAMELMVAMEHKYRVKIPEAEFTQITNLNQAVATTQKYLTASA